MLNIITDENNNINHFKICNIFIQTFIDSLHYISENIESIRFNAMKYAF